MELNFKGPFKSPGKPDKKPFLFDYEKNQKLQKKRPLSMEKAI